MNKAKEAKGRGKGFILPTVYKKDYAKLLNVPYNKYRTNIWVLYADVNELEILNSTNMVLVHKKF